MCRYTRSLRFLQIFGCFGTFTMYTRSKTVEVQVLVCYRAQIHTITLSTSLTHSSIIFAAFCSVTVPHLLTQGSQGFLYKPFPGLAPDFHTGTETVHMWSCDPMFSHYSGGGQGGGEGGRQLSIAPILTPPFCPHFLISENPFNQHTYLP